MMFRAFDLAGAYGKAKRTFRHALRDDDDARRTLDTATEALEPFARSWRPTPIAHNDCYDDQMLVLPDGRIALVDFEEAGPGDPLLDVGNFLAHLQWAARFGRKRKTDASGPYHERFRAAALERFGWSERDLDLREPICLFRIRTNTIRRLEADWQERTVAGLRLVNETLNSTRARPVRALSARAASTRVRDAAPCGREGASRRHARRQHPRSTGGLVRARALDGA